MLSFDDRLGHGAGDINDKEKTYNQLTMSQLGGIYSQQSQHDKTDTRRDGEAIDRG